MTTLIGLSGSLREGSFNSALLRAAAALVPPGATLEIATIRCIPLYDGDLEADDGIPATVEALKDAIAAANGLVLVTPEYNNSMPGVAKNAVDWLSRPAVDIARVFGGKPVGLMGASPGGFGTHPEPERLAAGLSHPGRAAVVRGAADGAARPGGFRGRRLPGRRQGPRRAGHVPPGLRRVRRILRALPCVRRSGWIGLP